MKKYFLSMVISCWAFIGCVSATDGGGGSSAGVLREVLTKGDQRLFKFVKDRAQPVEALSEVVNAGGDVNAQNKLGQTPLMVAIKKRRIEILEYLISLGADLSLTDKDGRSAIDYLFEQKLKNVIESIDDQLYHDLDKILQSDTLLHSIVKSNSESLMHKICNDDELVIHEKNIYGQTALHIACAKWDSNAVDFLINKGAEKNSPDAFGYTPLMYAVIHNKSEIVKTLVNKHNVDIYIRDKHGCKAARYLSAESNKSMAAFFQGKKIVRAEPLASASAGGASAGGGSSAGAGSVAPLKVRFAEPVATQVAQSKIGQRVKERMAEYGLHSGNLKEQDKEGYTALHLAAYKGRLDDVNLFITAGADPNSMANNRWTPLFSAVYGRDKAILQKLIDSGGKDLSRKDGDGWAPLHHAAYYDLVEVAEVLLANGAEKDAPDIENSWSPLHHAAYNDSEQVAKVLLSRGANFNIKDKDGDTPLHVAADKGNTRTLNTLLKSGADSFITNNKGYTVLKVAKLGKHSECIALLRALKKQSGGGSAGAGDASKPKEHLMPPKLRLQPVVSPVKSLLEVALSGGGSAGGSAFSVPKKHSMVPQLKLEPVVPVENLVSTDTDDSGSTSVVADVLRALPYDQLVRAFRGIRAARKRVKAGSDGASAAPAATEDAGGGGSGGASAGAGDEEDGGFGYAPAHKKSRK